MTLPRVFRGALVGAVVACVVLSGCTRDDPAPEPTSAAVTDEPTADATTEPAEIVPPEKPTLMASNDAIGARAAAEYFLSLYGYVFQTGDLTEWDAMCDPESEFCNGVRDAVTEHVASGNVQTGGEATISVGQVLEPSGALEEYEVSGLMVQEAYEIVDEGGQLVSSDEGEGEIPTSIFLKMDSAGEWHIRAVAMGS
ncbi:DUF6318 family protein [Sanguibacter sp. 25GB23B1]|uniref:DUF6318 family protein n=1 Tax=unclassified Sanguibacter TaxID=2645534 RepID=UPI0032AF4F7F